MNKREHWRPIHILVVDDSKTMRTSIVRNLRRMGFDSTVEADDGDSALAAIESDPLICIAILDLRMPGSSGLDFLRNLRHKHPDRELQVLILTASRDERDVKDAIAAGAADFMIKPFNIPLFESKILDLIRRSSEKLGSHLGQFLVARQAVSATQLAMALDVQRLLDPTRIPVGTIAVIRGICDPLDVMLKVRTMAAQSQADHAWMLARLQSADFLEGLADADEIARIMELIGRPRLLLGEIMVQLGFLSTESLEQHLDAFLSEQS